MHGKREGMHGKHVRFSHILQALNLPTTSRSPLSFACRERETERGDDLILPILNYCARESIGVDRLELVTKSFWKAIRVEI